MAKEKKASFYSINDYSSGLTNGRSITVSNTISYNGENANFTQFLSTPPKELEKQLKASMTEEKKVYDSLKKAIKSWEQHWESGVPSGTPAFTTAPRRKPSAGRSDRKCVSI